MRVVNFAGHPGFLRMTHSASLLSMLNAFVRSMKTVLKHMIVLFSAFLLNLCEGYVTVKIMLVVLWLR